MDLKTTSAKRAEYLSFVIKWVGFRVGGGYFLLEEPGLNVPEMRETDLELDLVKI